MNPDSIVFKQIFPVVAGRTAPGEGVVLRDVFGTALHLGDGVFITAGHVLDAVQAEERAGIGVQVTGGVEMWDMAGWERMPGMDLGVFQSRPVNDAPLPWDTSVQPGLRGVWTAGFPYAVDFEHMLMQSRCFQGHIVASLRHYPPPDGPASYELSFQCPRGLSGAPILLATDPPTVVGLVVGNASTQMEVFSSREVIREGNELVVERYEAIHFGSAIQSGAIGRMSSPIVTATILEHVNTFAGGASAGSNS